MALRTRADHISPGSRPELLDRRLQNRRSCYQLGSLGCCNPVEHERVAVADDAMRASFGINASEDHPWSDTIFWWSGTASIRRPPVVQTDAHIRMGTGAMKFSEPYEAGRQHAPFRSPPSVPGHDYRAHWLHGGRPQIGLSFCQHRASGVDRLVSSMPSAPRTSSRPIDAGADGCNTF